MTRSHNINSSILIFVSILDLKEEYLYPLFSRMLALIYRDSNHFVLWPEVLRHIAHNLPRRETVMIKIFTLLFIVFTPILATAETQYEVFEDEIKLSRQIVSNQRNDLVLKNMGLSVMEEKSFFGTYNAYRDEMKPLLDQEIKLLTDYADTYVKNNLKDEQALKFATTFLELKSKKIALRLKFVDKFKKSMSPKHIARFIQLENKLDAIMNYDFARKVPLVPVK